MTEERYTDYDNINVQGHIQSSTQGRLVGSFQQMPVAQEKYLGQIIVYTGTTDQDFTNNRSYQCKEVSAGVFQWVDVTPSQELNLTQNRAVISGSEGELTTSQVTATELQTLSGVSSGIQSQINDLGTQISSKQGALSSANAGANITITGFGDNVIISSQAQLGTQWGSITGDIDDQTDLNQTFQKTITGGATTIATQDLTADKALISSQTGKVQASQVTQTELGYVSGVTSGIQTQIGGLQNQIDAIVSKSDVVDVVQTYQDLQNYDTTALGNNDIVKVLSDSQHNNSESYYRWVITLGVGAWNYIGSLGATYTKGETDQLLQDKQDKLTAGSGISIQQDGTISNTAQPDVDKSYVDTGLGTKADTDLQNANVGSQNSGKFVQVSSTGALQYSDVDMSQKANIQLDNVTLGAQNKDKFLKVTASGGITYDTPVMDISGKADVDLGNINVGVVNEGKVPQITSQGKFQYIDIDSQLSDSSSNPISNQAVYSELNESIVKNVELDTQTQGQPKLDVTTKNLATNQTAHTFLNLYSHLQNKDLTNVQVDTQNADKYLKVTSQGGIAYDTPVDTTYSASSGLVLTGTAFSVNTSYTTSGRNYQIQVDVDSGGLFVNVPWIDTNTQVTQTSTDSNDSYPLLFKGTAGTTTVTDTQGFGTGITANPSTSTISATTFSGNLSGTASYATGIGGQSTNVGGAMQPMYVTQGVPSACSFTIIPHTTGDPGQSSTDQQVPTSLAVHNAITSAVPTMDVQGSATGSILSQQSSDSHVPSSLAVFNAIDNAQLSASITAEDGYYTLTDGGNLTLTDNTTYYTIGW